MFRIKAENHLFEGLSQFLKDSLIIFFFFTQFRSFLQLVDGHVTPSKMIGFHNKVFLAVFLSFQNCFLGFPVHTPRSTLMLFFENISGPREGG